MYQFNYKTYYNLCLILPENENTLLVLWQETYIIHPFNEQNNDKTGQNDQQTERQQKNITLNDINRLPALNTCQGPDGS